MSTLTHREYTAVDPVTGQQPAWRRWAALATLMLPVLLVAIDNTVLNFALPQISLEFAASGTLLLWVIDAYPLVLAGLLVTMGSLGDRIGRRRLLLIGGTGFAALSVFAAFAPSGELLVAARAALGFFGAMLMPATLALIRNIFDDRNERRIALAIWAAGFASGAAIGPIVGGLLLQHFAWGSVFLIAVPLLVPMLILTPIWVPESKDPNPGRLQVLDVVLSMATLAPAVLAIKTLAKQGFSATAVLALLVALAAGAVFVRRQLTRPQPMLDLKLFRYAPFTGSVLANLLAVFSLVGFLYYAAQHLQLVLGLDPLTAGLVLLPGAIAMVVAGLLVVPLVRRVPANRIVAVALLLSAASYGIVAVVGNGASVLALMAAFVILSIGIGAAETLSNDIIIDAVPTAKSGAAAAISETAYEVGSVLGTAVLGSMLVASYRGAVALPAGLSAEQQQLAHETLGGAVTVSEQLPADLAEQLLASAHHAFDSGVVYTSGLAAIIMAGAAVLAYRALRTG
ncbi:MFS transporter [Nakamurella aerolata]|uniref:MFS transporter n=1 Tax=Nakamurella aerolata TaxID=1656892 RepID=A0A849AAQ9_9ACTN|nr:MFS transporter [Nakamurella aerolata]NNG37037.1 MFS transporter [Nakamurella aerolata]